MQLLQLALPSDDPSQEELISQMRQPSELLRSDKLGEIDLPVSSAVIAQRIQQQQLLLVAASSPATPPPSSSSSSGSACTPSLATATATSAVTAAFTSSSASLQASGNHVKHHFMNNGHHNHLGSKSTNSILGNGFSVNGGIGHGANLSASVASMAPNSINFHNSHTNLPHNSGGGGTASVITNGSHHNQPNSISSASSASQSSSLLSYRNHRRSGDRSDKSINDPSASTGRPSAVGQSGSCKATDQPRQRPNGDGYAVSLFRDAGRLTGALTSSVSLLRSKLFAGFLSSADSGQRHGKRSSDESNESPPPQIVSAAKTTAPATTTPPSTPGAAVANHLGSAACHQSALATASAPPPTNAKAAAREPRDGASAKDRSGHKLNGHIDLDLSTSAEHSVPIGNGEIIEKNRGQLKRRFVERSARSNHGPCAFAGRRNRTRQKETSAKDNHMTASQASPHVPEIKENGIAHSVTVSLPAAAVAPPHPQQCENCFKFEIEMKKSRNEISQLKQSENEYRTKYEQNFTTKSCLQAKQRENEELEKK